MISESSRYLHLNRKRLFLSVQALDFFYSSFPQFICLKPLDYIIKVPLKLQFSKIIVSDLKSYFDLKHASLSSASKKSSWQIEGEMT